jgi:hypothetical protein
MRRFEIDVNRTMMHSNVHDDIVNNVDVSWLDAILVRIGIIREMEEL